MAPVVVALSTALGSRRSSEQPIWQRSNPPLQQRYGVHAICETSLPQPPKNVTFQEKKDERISTETTPCLKREVGLLSTIALLIGLAVGSSIFTVPSIVFVKTGSAGVVIVLFSLAGVKALMGGLCYAELAALLPASGGNYAYLTAASKSMGKYGDVIPFMSAWVSLTISEPMTAAYQGLTFSSYALSLVYGDCSLSYSANVITALAFTALGTAVNCFSVKTSARVQGVLTTIKTFVLISIIITGAVWAFRANKLLEAPLFAGVTPSNLAQAFFAATSCYGGCNSITYIAEEIKDPTRTIPLAMAIGIVILTLVNVLTNVAFFVVLDASTVASSDAIAVSFAMVTWGTAVAFCVPLVVSVSAFGSLCAGFFSGSRLKLAAARQGHLPQVLSFITVDSSVPLPKREGERGERVGLLVALVLCAWDDLRAFPKQVPQPTCHHGLS
ncbi:Y+L amino acid transporter 2 [Ixodes scapularis]